MKQADKAKQLAAEAIDKLRTALDAGHSDTLAAHLQAMARFHNYSFGNIMLIASQRPDATRVAGYRTWQKLGRQVRKGEKGILIIAPMVLRKDNAEDAREEEAMLRFRAAYVFDVAQTEGEPLPELDDVQGNPSEYTPRLKALIAEQGITLSYADADELDGAHGVSRKGAIVIRYGLPPADEFSTLAHELAHEMLHTDRGPNRPPRALRETEAEATAFVVCEAIGLQNGNASRDYIHLYNGDANMLTASLDRIQKTAAGIIRGISEQDTLPVEQRECVNA